VETVEDLVDRDKVVNPAAGVDGEVEEGVVDHLLNASVHPVVI